MRATAAPMDASSSARRSAAPDPGAAKKPRLAQQAASARDPRSYAGGGGGGGSNGGAAAPPAAPAADQAQVEELVAQYRAALGELTFNSKPIITNLTIIAGENLHAAKPIASLICANILEVPSEQKLPSLYLLDSIAKNIGKDYLKHFSARLPDVFCKAYRQVDSAIHNSMRHLFGTWKGVFSPLSLQVIEKELGFQSSANGSSAAAPSKPDSQSQRPSQSIHVNPKYLEARQQLQQPSKGILGAGAKTAILSDTGDDIERVNRIAIDRSAGRRLDVVNSRPNVQRTQRDPFSNPIHEKPDRDVRALGLSNISHQTAVGAGRLKSKSQDGVGGPYYTSGIGTSEEQLDRHNNFTARSSGSVRLDSALLPTPASNSDRLGRPSSNKNWKNSEEEEYMWDDVRSQGADYGGISSSRRNEWMADDGNVASFQRVKWAELGGHLDPELHKPDSFPRFGNATGQDRRASYTGHEDYLYSKREVEPRINREMLPEGQQLPPSRGSSLWLSHQKSLPDIGSDHRISTFSNQPAERPTIYSGALSTSITSSVPIGLSGAYPGRSSLESASIVPTRSTEAIGQQKHRHWSSPSPPVHSPSPSFARQGSPSSAELEVYPARSFSQLGQNAALSLGLPSLPTTLSQGPQQIEKHPTVQSKSHLKPIDQPQIGYSHENSSSLFKPSIQLPISVGMGHLQPEEVPLPRDSALASSDHISASNLLAGLMKSGFKPNDPNDLGSLRTQPPLPSGPPSHVSASFLAASSSLQHPASENATLKPHAPNSLCPPSTQTTDKAAPLSSLLSSLVAKGLISSPSTDSSVAVPQQPGKSNLSTPDVAALTPPLSITQPSVVKATSNRDSSGPKKMLLPQPADLRMTDLIGLEFKPDILRKYHEHVISSLFDDQSHQCNACGLRFRHEEELNEHNACHGSKQSEARSIGIAPERWFPSKSNWVDGSLEAQDSFLESASDECSLDEVCEFMVPADESQIICALCGEPFDDIYSVEKDNWMYKDAVCFDYLNVEGNCGSSAQSKQRVPIVHVRCMPRSSNNGMEVD